MTNLMEVIPMLNPRICNHCANAYKETCVAECAPTGNYCAFEPRPLREGEQPPPFPIADFLKMTAREARVLMGLYLYWLSEFRARDGRSLSPNGDHPWSAWLRERQALMASEEAPNGDEPELTSRPNPAAGRLGVTGPAPAPPPTLCGNHYFDRSIDLQPQPTIQLTNQPQKE